MCIETFKKSCQFGYRRNVLSVFLYVTKDQDVCFTELTRIRDNILTKHLTYFRNTAFCDGFYTKNSLC